jgi:poly(beta-D-mannuronate) lyase
MMKLKIFLSVFLLLSATLHAKEYPIRSAAELKALQLQPGDRVVLLHGEWKDQKLVFKGKGTEAQPIVLMTEKPGSTKFTGHSGLDIDGEWLVADGLYFTEGWSEKGDLIRFTERSRNCRLTNSAIVNFNHPEKTFDYKWVSMWGHQNRVDHCWIEGKAHQGTTLVVWLDSLPTRHRIDHNYFGQRPELGVNGGETIRIGNSFWSMSDSYTIVEQNIFEHCDGEIEAISNKSGSNLLRDNLFYECRATLTLRHGNGSRVEGNYFIGNGLPNTGGVRIIGERHTVTGNYFYGLTGTGLSSAVSIMDGLPNPVLTSHWQVKDARVHNNAIINCNVAFSIGAGKNKDRYLRPENCVIDSNTIHNVKKVIDWVDDSAQVRFAANRVTDATMPADPGFLKGTDNFPKNGEALLVYLRKKPFWYSEAVGPSWHRAPVHFIIK